VYLLAAASSITTSCTDQKNALGLAGIAGSRVGVHALRSAVVPDAVTVGPDPLQVTVTLAPATYCEPNNTVTMIPILPPVMNHVAPASMEPAGATEPADGPVLGVTADVPPVMH
jgi:hypothetical protein